MAKMLLNIRGKRDLNFPLSFHLKKQEKEEQIK